MQHFYAYLTGANKRRSTAYGTRISGLVTRALTRDGEIEVSLSYDAYKDKDKYEIVLYLPHSKVAKKVHIASGYFQ